VPTRPENPAPLTVAASLVVIQGALLLTFAVLELAHISSERVSLGVSTAVFFVIYGGVLVLCAWALTRQQGWARGPVLLTQLIQIGLAWNLRDTAVVAVVLLVAALIVIVGMLHPATIEALTDDPTGAG
jgi:cytochrome c biogenesis factor